MENHAIIPGNQILKCNLTGAMAGAATGAYRKINLKDATIEAELLREQSHDQLGVPVGKLSESKGGW